MSSVYRNIIFISAFIFLFGCANDFLPPGEKKAFYNDLDIQPDGHVRQLSNAKTPTNYRILSTKISPSGDVLCRVVDFSQKASGSIETYCKTKGSNVWKR